MDFYLLLAAILLFIVGMTVLGERILLSSLLRPKKNDEAPVSERFPDEVRFSVQTAAGFALSCLFIPVNGSGEPPEKLIILLHDYNSSKQSMFKYVTLFRERGFSVIIPDLRFCGESGGDNVGLAILDADDISGIFRWIHDCYGDGVPTGIFGEGFGGSAAMLVAANKNVSFVIADSAFSDLHIFFKERIRADYRIKQFPMLTIAELILRKKYGIDVKKVNITKLLSDSTACPSAPFFFIHGENDAFILPQMSVDMYNAKTIGYKKFYLAAEAAHCGGFASDPDVYTEKIYEFLDKTKM